MAHLALYLFGSFQAALDGKEIAHFATDKVRALLAYLAVESDRPHRRDALAGLLWPELPQAHARQSLRQTLTRIRHALEDHDPAQPILLIHQDQVQFNAGAAVSVDVGAFTALWDACQSHPHRSLDACRPCLDRLERAVALYRADFLDQFFLPDSIPFEEWALLKRDRLRQQAMIALAALAAFFERRADYAQAQHYAWRQVELEPWCEEAHQQLLRLLALTGQRSAALAQYESCCRALAEHLAVEPTPATVALIERIRVGHPLISSPPHNLPTLPTPFVGRKKELADIADLLAHPDTRLVTLVGSGGIGKSRLALQVLEEHRGLYAHGIAFAPLDAVESAEFISFAIARALRFSLQGRQNPDEQLLNYLRGKRILLALDNLEHLLQDCTLLEQILRQAPGVTLLATSRERLNLREEHVYQLEGLDYPPTEAVAFDAAQHSAVTLFAQSAQRVDRRFTLDAETLPAVLRICRLMEGVPLGLELAAAWVHTHTCADIAQHLSVNSELLTSTLRNIDPRHRSLRASLDYSWSLLTSPERTCLARLAVFQGGFDRRAAIQVADATAGMLARLLHKSLLRAGSDRRYTLHPLLHQYLAEKLAATAEAAAIRTRHGRYYTAFLQQREQALKSAAQIHTLDDIAVEIENIRQAFRWTLRQLREGRDVPASVQALDAGIEGLHLFYLLRDWYQEGETLFGAMATALEAASAEGASDAAAQRLLGRVLARQGKYCEFTEFANKAQTLFQRSLLILQSQTPEDPELALPLNGLGYMAMLKGEAGAAEQYLERSLAHYRQAADPWGEANILSNQCLLLRRRGEFTAARQAGLQSLALRRTIGDLRGIAAALNSLGLVECSLGDYAAAEQAFNESLSICQELNYRVGISNALNGLCQATFFRGDPAAAERFGQDSLALCRDIGDQWGVGVALNNLGCIALERQAYARARNYFLEGIAVFREFDIKSSLGNALNNLGEAAYRLGEHQEARAALREALALTHATGNTPILIEVIVRLAQLTVHENAAARGLEWLCVVAEHPAMLDEVRHKTIALREELAARFTPAALKAIEERARSRDLAAIVEELL